MKNNLMDLEIAESIFLNLQNRGLSGHKPFFYMLVDLVGMLDAEQMKKNLQLWRQKVTDTSPLYEYLKLTIHFHPSRNFKNLLIIYDNIPYKLGPAGWQVSYYKKRQNKKPQFKESELINISSNVRNYLTEFVQTKASKYSKIVAIYQKPCSFNRNLMMIGSDMDYLLFVTEEKLTASEKLGLKKRFINGLRNHGVYALSKDIVISSSAKFERNKIKLKNLICLYYSGKWTASTPDFLKQVSIKTVHPHSLQAFLVRINLFRTASEINKREILSLLGNSKTELQKILENTSFLSDTEKKLVSKIQHKLLTVKMGMTNNNKIKFSKTQERAYVQALAGLINKNFIYISAFGKQIIPLWLFNFSIGDTDTSGDPINKLELQVSSSGYKNLLQLTKREPAAHVATKSCSANKVYNLLSLLDQNENLFKSEKGFSYLLEQVWAYSKPYDDHKILTWHDQSRIVYLKILKDNCARLSKQKIEIALDLLLKTRFLDLNMPYAFSVSIVIQFIINIQNVLSTKHKKIIISKLCMLVHDKNVYTAQKALMALYVLDSRKYHYMIRRYVKQLR